MRTHTSPVSSKGQVTIPVDIRRRLRIDETSQVVFVVNDDDTVQLKPVRYTLEEVLGGIPTPSHMEDVDLAEAGRSAWEEHAERETRRMFKP